MNRYLINVVMKVPHQVVVDAADPFEARAKVADMGWELYEAGGFPDVPEEPDYFYDYDSTGRKPYYFLQDITGNSF